MAPWQTDEESGDQVYVPTEEERDPNWCFMHDQVCNDNSAGVH